MSRKRSNLSPKVGKELDEIYNRNLRTLKEAQKDGRRRISRVNRTGKRIIVDI